MQCWCASRKIVLICSPNCIHDHCYILRSMKTQVLASPSNFTRYRARACCIQQPSPLIVGGAVSARVGRGKVCGENATTAASSPTRQTMRAVSPSASVPRSNSSGATELTVEIVRPSHGPCEKLVPYTSLPGLGMLVSSQDRTPNYRRADAAPKELLFVFRRAQGAAESGET